jgi:hypothetical protein
MNRFYITSNVERRTLNAELFLNRRSRRAAGVSAIKGKNRAGLEVGWEHTPVASFPWRPSVKKVLEDLGAPGGDKCTALSVAPYLKNLNPSCN